MSCVAKATASQPGVGFHGSFVGTAQGGPHHRQAGRQGEGGGRVCTVTLILNGVIKGCCDGWRSRKERGWKGGIG